MRLMGAPQAFLGVYFVLSFRSLCPSCTLISLCFSTFRPLYWPSVFCHSGFLFPFIVSFCSSLSSTPPRLLHQRAVVHCRRLCFCILFPRVKCYTVESTYFYICNEYYNNRISYNARRDAPFLLRTASATRCFSSCFRSSK